MLKVLRLNTHFPLSGLIKSRVHMVRNPGRYLPRNTYSKMTVILCAPTLFTIEGSTRSANGSGAPYVILLLLQYSSSHGRNQSLLDLVTNPSQRCFHVHRRSSDVRFILRPDRQINIHPWWARLEFCDEVAKFLPVSVVGPAPGR